MLPWNELLANLAIVALATSIWTVCHGWMGSMSLTRQRLAFGLVMGAATLVVMLVQFQFTPGVYLDLRYTLLAVTAYFGGPLAVVIPMIVAIAKRLHAGGTGIQVAIPHIALAVSFGLFGFYRMKSRSSFAALVYLSLAVVFSGTVGFFVMVPSSSWPGMVRNVVGPFASVLFVSTFFASFAISQELKRQRLVQENLIYRAVFEALPDCLNAKDLGGRFIAANSATASLMGARGVADLIGKSDFDFFPAAVAENFRYDEKRQRLSNAPLTVEQKFLRSNGTEAWLSTLKAPLLDAYGSTIGVITHNREITDQKLLELRLEETRRNLSDAISSMADGLAMFDADDALVFCNSKYQTMFPLTSDIRIPGSRLKDMVQASIRRGEVKPIAGNIVRDADELVAQLKTPSVARQVELTDGRWLEARCRATKLGGFLIVYSDVTDAKDGEQRLHELNQKLHALANTDQLTSLPNRRAFDQHLDAAIFDATMTDGDVALLMIDVDHFKLYNDSYGHVAGDEALQKVAVCIDAIVSNLAGAKVSRYGGEEFAAVIPYVSVDEAKNVGLLLCAAVRSLAISHKTATAGHITVSVGTTAMLANESLSREAMIESADSALYQAKAEGRDRVQVFSSRKNHPSLVQTIPKTPPRTTDFK
jgi:diguanylate cyclase (GGDEF)-like protein/PAS domain S-box-containing protein